MQGFSLESEGFQDSDIWAINNWYSAKDILNYIGCNLTETSPCRCPFHGKHAEGRGMFESRQSAKFFEETNTLYCWAESKTYRPYDMLEFLGWTKQQMISQIDFNNLRPRVIATESSIFKDKDTAGDAKIQYMAGRVKFKEYVNNLFEMMRNK